MAAKLSSNQSKVKNAMPNLYDNVCTQKSRRLQMRVDRCGKSRNWKQPQAHDDSEAMVLILRALETDLP
jgi:hypothetical protein